MILLYLLGIIVAALICYVGITQIGIPIVNGTKIFPGLRADKLAAEVSALRTKVMLLKEKNSNLNELSSLTEKQAVFQKHIEELQAKLKADAEKVETQSTTNKE